MSRKRSNRWFLVGGLVLLALLYTRFGVQDVCVEDTNPSNYCFQGAEVSFSCKDGVRIQETTACPLGSTCYEGFCIPNSCTETQYQCRNDYSSIKTECLSGKPVSSVSLCLKGLTCKNQTGKCEVVYSTVCGNGVCESEEDKLNCPRDCGLLSSWAEYNREVSENIALQADLQCGGEIDCDNSIVQKAVQDIERQYDTSTPIKFIDSVVDWTHKLIQYDVNGGLNQCGESASNLLARYYGTGVSIRGNCVDYSTVLTTILRYKKIPAKQVGVCVFTGWTCTPFAIIGGEPLHVGYIRGDQAIGHAITKVYAGKDFGYVTADPTVARTIGASCVSYSQVLAESSSGQVCAIPTDLYNQYCIQ